MNSTNLLTRGRRGLLAMMSIVSLLSPFAVNAQSAAEFIRAIRENDTNAVSRMMLADKSLTQASYVGRLPLHIAASEGHMEIVKMLLQHGVDVNAPGDTWATSNHQITALDAAIWYDHPEICLLLLDAGADLNRLSPFHGTALHVAFTYRREEIAEWLLDRGANPFLESGGYRKTTAFELAITSGTGKLVPRMLRLVSVTPVTPEPGARLQNQEVVPSFTDEATRFLDRHGQRMLTAAVLRGQLEAVEALFDAGVSATATQEEDIPILQAMALAEANAASARDFPTERWAAIRALLVRHGAMDDVFAATGRGDASTVQRLLSSNTNAIHLRDAEGQTPLHWAVRTDHPNLTTFWLEAGVPTASTNLTGQTALHLAAALGRVEHATLLLSVDAPTTVQDTNGWTPLDAAIQAKQSETIRLLLPDEPSGMRPARGPATLLHKAAEEGDIVALTVSLSTADVEARNELGQTALQVAVLNGRLGAAALLVDQGADVNARNPGGSTVMHLILEPENRLFIRDRPSASWLAQVGQDSSKQKYLRYLEVGQYEQGPHPILQAASFLLVCGLDATATNHAGLSTMQMATDEESLGRVMVFDEDRAALWELLQGAGGNIDTRDANGDTALHRAARGLFGDDVAALIAGGANVNATNHQGRPPLHVSAEDLSGWGHQPFQALLAASPNVNARDNEGMTVLHLLARSDSTFKAEAIEALLESGADPNARDSHDRTPAHLLFSGEWPWIGAGECLPLLEKHGTDLSAVDDQGQTPLHYLAGLGSQSPLFFIRGITNCFTAAKADLSPLDRQGDTPLHVAARSGTWDVFDWLRTQGAALDTTNDLGESPRTLAARNTDRFNRFRPSPETDMFDAAREGNLESLKRMLNGDPTLVNLTNRFGQRPLRIAAMVGRTNTVDYLVQQGAEWDALSAVLTRRAQPLRDVLAREPAAIRDGAFGEGLLHLAAGNGDVEILRILIDAGADLQVEDDRGLSPLGLALLQHQAEASRFLRQCGAAENIFDAIWGGDVDKAKALLDGYKSLVHSTNRSGASTMEIAAGTGHTDILKLLLGKGAETDSKNMRTGRTPLHAGVLANQADAVEWLIGRGANIEARDKKGFTALHLAAMNDSTDTANCLLRHRSNPNSRTSGAMPGRFPGMGGPPSSFAQAANTPLHFAALCAQTNMIPVLLSFGASINATNSTGRTALDLTHELSIGLSEKGVRVGP